MKFPRFISNNLILKITSLNSGVVVFKLLISVFIQRFLAIMVGESGVAKIGQLRNLTDMLTGFSSLGTFNGIIKYISEFKNNNKELQDLFSTTVVFVTIASLLSMLILFFGAPYFSEALFNSTDYVFILRVLAFIAPFMAVKNVFEGIINGLSAYKIYAKTELVSYVLSSLLLIIALYTYNLKGVLFAIAITPVLYFIVVLSIYGKILSDLIRIKTLKFKTPYFKKLLGFSVMSITAHLLFNYVEIDLRNSIANRLNFKEAGYWTAMTNLSKNYMIFASGVFSLYILPKFADIETPKAFKKEVLNIYKTLLPLFAMGMILIYIFRNNIVQFVYPNFLGLEPLFKWQLLGDFVRLASFVVAIQFVAKRMVGAFVVSEVFSTFVYYFLANYLIDFYGTEGVVIANFLRYILYYMLIVVLIFADFKSKKIKFE